jgi:hypothetical protein
LATQRTHYEVLGLPQDASTDDIKRRYRELARRYHPDLNKERPDANEVFIRIGEAYAVLGDATRRAAYDLMLRDQARKAKLQRDTGSTGAATSAGGSQSAGARPTPASMARDARVRRDSERNRQEIYRLLEEARLAYGRGHLGEARTLCQDIVRRGRVGAAHELLGDIFARQGRLDDAINHYTQAAQLQPNSSLVMAKLNRVLEWQSGGRPGKQFDARLTATVPAGARLGYSLMVTCFGAALVLFLMLFAPGLDKAKLGWALVPDWTMGHLFAMAACGLLAGGILSAAGWVRRFDQVMLPPVQSNGRRSIPMVLLLGLLGIVFLPVSALAYLLVSYWQESWSVSVLTSFCVAFLLALGFSQAPTEGAVNQTILFGGNVLYLCLLVGWFLGDFFRPGWSG